ncbi:MAG: hypothetical protein JSS20_08385 [Proteobacteria bacterium]|nr:hypothetical protein [Pseudomonadota bacterium]
MRGREAGAEAGTGGDRRRLRLLALILNAASLFLVVLPVVIYGYLGNGLSADRLMLYVVGLILIQAVATAFLIWTFRFAPGR